MMKKLFQNKRFRYTLIGIVAIIVICLGVTYAYWMLTKEQTERDVVKSACLKIDFSGKDDITLDEAYPMEEDELEYFLTTQKPYHFTITNKCNNLQKAVINLETLNVSNTLLEDDYIDVLLYEEDYNNNLNSNKKLTGNTINDSNKVIKDARHAYAIYNFTLKNNETREFNLQVYLDKDTPMDESTMNASWQGKITLSTEYMKDTNTIREIVDTDEEGMWKYKEQLTKIVIEDKKDEKVALDNEVIYGPFAESVYGSNGVQSYVVCEIGDINCIGYLQGDGGVKLNQNSSYLFSGFTNVVNIMGFENVDTSEVTNMDNMFSDCSSLKGLALYQLDTSHVTSMHNIFNGDSSLLELNLSRWNLSNLSSATGPELFGDNTSLKTIYMNSVTFPTNSSNFFSGLTQLVNLYLGGSNTSQVTDMSYMFAGLSNVVESELYLGGFSTKQVTNMSHMFDGCSQITELSLGAWNTSNVINMDKIFNDMTSLRSLNLVNWDLSKLNNPILFGNNDSLSSIIMAYVKFPSSVTGFFSEGLSNLTELILAGVDTSNTINMSGMFANCSSLTNLDLNSFNTINVSNMSGMFSNMTNLKSLSLSNFKTNNLTSVGGMFSKDSNLMELNLSNWIFSDTLAKNFVANASLNSISLNKLILSNVNTSNVTTMENMFSYLSTVEELNLSSFDTHNLTNMDSMFYGMTNLKTLNLSNWNFNKVTVGFGGSSNALGYTLGSVENLILYSVNTSEVTDMQNLFAGMSSLKALNLSSFDTRKVTSMSSMFSGCSGLTSLDLSMFDTTKLTGSTAMFNKMNSLQELNLSNWKFNDSMSRLFASNSGLSNNSNFNSLVLENVDTSNVTNMDSMFMSLPVTTLDLSSFDTSHVTNMRLMFGFMSNLQSLNISSFDTNLVTDMSAMFVTDSKLTEINYGSNFVHNPTVVIDSMFSGTNAPRPSHSSWQNVSFD